VSRRRDALLALVTLTPLLAISLATGPAARLGEPRPAVVGVVGTLLVELVLRRSKRASQALWSRRCVRVAGVGAVLFVAGAATASGKTFVVTALVWGLLAYLVLLGGVVAGEHAAGDGR
jgi:hypothetical protein